MHVYAGLDVKQRAEYRVHQQNITIPDKLSTLSDTVLPDTKARLIRLF